ncbi:MAG: hypothetical protein H0V29_05150 [Thermoleophilaceae bacterium]|nr:hypothetical protein [Thermoleophilaceae bacterium]
MPRGSTKTVKVKLSSKGRKLLRKRGRLRAVVAARITSPAAAAAPALTKRSVTLRVVR